jgi:hypothetical protein
MMGKLKGHQGTSNKSTCLLSARMCCVGDYNYSQMLDCIDRPCR